MEVITVRSPTDDLKALVSKAQAYDQVAIDELYYRFRGMVINCIKREDVRKSLGEDAENIAWEVFYSVVHSLDLEHVRSIEAVLKAGLYNGITKKMMKNTTNTVSFDPQDEANQDLAVAEDTYETILASYAFASFLRELADDERKLMQLIYIEGVNLTEASKTIGRSYKATAKLKYKCLRKLKKYLES